MNLTNIHKALNLTGKTVNPNFRATASDYSAPPIN